MKLVKILTNLKQIFFSVLIGVFSHADNIKWTSSGHHFKHQDPQRPPIDRKVVLFTPQDFRGDIIGSATKRRSGVTFSNPLLKHIPSNSWFLYEVVLIPTLHMP